MIWREDDFVGAVCGGRRFVFFVLSDRKIVVGRDKVEEAVETALVKAAAEGKGYP